MISNEKVTVELQVPDDPSARTLIFDGKKELSFKELVEYWSREGAGHYKEGDRIIILISE
jgi:hypothetical protein